MHLNNNNNKQTNNNNTCLTTRFRGKPISRYKKVKPSWILLQQWIVEVVVVVVAVTTLNLKM